MRKIIMDSKIKILIGIFVVGLVLTGGWWIWNTQVKKANNGETINLVEDKNVIKNAVLENTSKFENIEDAKISIDQIEIKGNQASADVFIRWGKGLGVGYKCDLVKVGEKWIVTSRERTIVE